MSNNFSNLSVVIVTYKTELSILEKCLSSIDPSIKVIIVENSTKFLNEDQIGNKYKNVSIFCTGENIGYARVERVSVDANTSRVLRKWSKIKPGMIALENPKRTYVGSFSFGFSETSPEALINLKISSNPFGKLDGKISFQGGSLKTKFLTYDQEVSYKSTGFVGLGIHLDYNLLNVPFGLLTTGLTLPFYFTSTLVSIV